MRTHSIFESMKFVRMKSRTSSMVLSGSSYSDRGSGSLSLHLPAKDRSAFLSIESDVILYEVRIHSRIDEVREDEVKKTSSKALSGCSSSDRGSASLSSQLPTENRSAFLSIRSFDSDVKNSSLRG